MASSSVQIRKKEPEIVVFKDPCKQRKKFHQQHYKRKNEKSSKKPEKPPEKHKQIRDFRYGNLKREVSKLALSAYTGKEREKAVESYLIKLGAHPIKKKKCENYKLFLERKKNEKEKEEEKTEKTEEFREEQLKKLITKAHKSITKYNKICKFKKKTKKQGKQ